MSRSSLSRRSLHRSAFTLIEILVVMLIIGLVLGLAGLAYMSHLEDAKVSTAQNQIGLLESGVDMHMLKQGKLPDRLSEIGPQMKNGKVPLDPWGNEYQYQKPGRSGSPYDIYSYGKDGQPGGEGLNADIYRKE